jgi:hypothetical protein
MILYYFFYFIFRVYSTYSIVVSGGPHWLNKLISYLLLKTRAVNFVWIFIRSDPLAYIYPLPRFDLFFTDAFFFFFSPSL